MKIISPAQIAAAFDEAAAIAAVEHSFVAFSAGRAQIGDAGHFTFDAAGGDCHVKAGHMTDDDIFVVKVASGFYGNARLELPSSQGFVALISSQTGDVLAILDDRGSLTALRTAMAGMLAAGAIGYAAGVLGIVGTGEQAQLQGEYIKRHLGAAQVLVWGRDSEKAKVLAAYLGGEASDLQSLVERADLIVTTTPSTEPLVRDTWVRWGTRIVAVGADGGGKRELDPAILAGATVVVDSRAHCIEAGEAGWAVRAGQVEPDNFVELGRLLAVPRTFGSGDIVVADLTGLAVQDAAIAGTIWRALDRSAAI